MPGKVRYRATHTPWSAVPVLFYACLISKVSQWLPPFDIYQISTTPTYSECGPKQIFGPFYREIAFRLCG